MKKLLFLTLTIGLLISCKDDKKGEIVEDGNYTWIYTGTFRETSSYVHADQDSSWLVKTDDTSFNNTFFLEAVNFNNTLLKVSENGDSTLIKENFLLDSDGSYNETSGGGSSLYSFSIKITNDSLQVSEKRNSGIANTFSSNIRAKQTN